MRIQDFPRPKNDTGRGVHWSASVYHPSGAALDFWIGELQAMKISWVKVLDDGGGSSLELCQRLLAADTMPVVRLFRTEPNPGSIGGREEETVRRLVAAGVRYFETNNEPDLPAEWKGGNRPADWLDVVTDNFIRDADRIIALGGLPAFPAMGVGNRFNPIATVIARGRADLFEKGAWIAIHNYTLNHPLDYPYDAINQKGEPVSAEVYDRLGPWAWENTSREQINAWRMNDKNPGDELDDDPSCFLAFHLLDQMVSKALGHAVPIISTEGGPIVGGKEDRRYPRITPALHAEMGIAITEFMQGERQIHGISCPESYFAACHWLIANYRIGFMNPGWESQAWYTDWWNNQFALHGELPLVAALKALPGPSEPVARTATLSGRVLRADTAAPLADLTVRLLQSGKDVQSVRTGTDGVFRFEKLATGVYDLAIEPWGIVRKSVTVAAATSAPLSILLVGGKVSVLSGSVQTAQGSPAADVIVLLAKESQAVGEVRTGKDGGFRFEQLAIGSYQLAIPGITIVGIGLDGWQTKNLKLTLGAATGKKYAVSQKRLLTAAETAGRRLFYGMVTDDAGKGINGVKLEMRWQGAAAGVQFPTTTTGKDPAKPAGYYEFLHTPGNYDLRVIQGDFPSEIAEALETARVSGREGQPVTYEVNFRRQAAATGPAQIDGVVSGGVAGRKVTLIGVTQSSSRETVLAASGSFTFRSIPAGKYRLALQGIGTIIDAITLQPASLLKVVFPLKSRLSGRVTGQTAGVVATLHAPPAWGWTRQTPIGADGSYVFEGLPSGRYRLQIGEQVVPDLILTGESSLQLAPIDLLQGRRSVIRGKVATAAGVAQKDIVIILRRGGSVTAQTKTGADGIYRFTNLPAGSYTLEAVGIGQVGGVIALDGEREHVADIAWPAPAPRGTIQGRVLSVEGKPQAARTVRLLRDGTEIASAQTDSSGVYRFTGLPAGIYALAVGDGTAQVTGIRLAEGANLTRDVTLAAVTAKTLRHYLLLGAPPAAGQSGHATAKLVHQLAIQHVGAGVITGYSADEAIHAREVTLIGDSLSVEVETMLKTSGCQVSRLSGDGYAIAAAFEQLFAEG